MVIEDIRNGEIVCMNCGIVLGQIYENQINDYYSDELIYPSWNSSDLNQRKLRISSFRKYRALMRRPLLLFNQKIAANVFISKKYSPKLFIHLNSLRARKILEDKEILSYYNKIIQKDFLSGRSDRIKIALAIYLYNVSRGKRNDFAFLKKIGVSEAYFKKVIRKIGRTRLIQLMQN